MPPGHLHGLGRLEVEFQTMLRLGDGDHLEAAKQAMMRGCVTVPRLAVLVERLAERIRGLAISDVPAFEGWLVELAEGAHAADPATAIGHARIAPFDAARLSAKAGTTHPIGGLLGSVQYDGPSALMADLYPLFRLGEWVRLGRKTGLGLGRIAVRHSHISE